MNIEITKKHKEDVKKYRELRNKELMNDEDFNKYIEDKYGDSDVVPILEYHYYSRSFNEAIKKSPPMSSIKLQTTVAISGYFTVLHKGHIDYMREARKLGTELIVIINNDEQQTNKKGKLIHKAEDIKKVIESIKYVDKAVIATDKDKTVCETLRTIKPDIFANGGDRTKQNVPEDKVCEELGIRMVYDVGGRKTLSSSQILSNKEEVPDFTASWCNKFEETKDSKYLSCDGNGKLTWIAKIDGVEKEYSSAEDMYSDRRNKKLFDD